jgi:hypothetical protein
MDPMKKAELVFGYPQACFNRKESKYQVKHHRCSEENKIDARMFPSFVPEVNEGKQCFDNPKNHHPAHKD